jgi:cytochrome c oxidase assembly factor CtaG
VALGEVVLAGVVGWLVFACWHGGIATLTTTLTDGTQLTSTRYFSGRIAGAIGLGVVVALLLVDAFRQFWLAVRIRPQKSKA